jgi:hypothetical protein
MWKAVTSAAAERRVGYFTTMNKLGSQVEKAGTKVTTPRAKMRAP